MLSRKLGGKTGFDCQDGPAAIYLTNASRPLHHSPSAAARSPLLQKRLSPRASSSQPFKIKPPVPLTATHRHFFFSPKQRHFVSTCSRSSDPPRPCSRHLWMTCASVVVDTARILPPVSSPSIPGPSVLFHQPDSLSLAAGGSSCVHKPLYSTVSGLNSALHHSLWLLLVFLFQFNKHDTTFDELSNLAEHKLAYSNTFCFTKTQRKKKRGRRSDQFEQPTFKIKTTKQFSRK